MRFFIFCSLFLWIGTGNGFAQQLDLLQDSSSQWMVIKSIQVNGNHRTKRFVITRELDFKEGDTLTFPKADRRLLLCRNRIFNTRLFTEVSVRMISDTINIDVKERYYTYPMPVIGLADRNFNEWWTIRHHDPKRIYYGINFTQKNVRGRNELLRINLQAGFYRKAEVSYTIPYLNKQRTVGLTTYFSFISEKRVAYKTGENILRYTEGKHALRTRFVSVLTLSYRGKYYTTSYFSLFYQNNHIGDTIAGLNPRYFLQGRTAQHYFGIRYLITHDRRDVSYYPLRGHYASLELSRLGLLPKDMINQESMYISLSGYHRLSEKCYLAAGFYQKLSFPFNQPYFNFRSLGYNIFTVSGYELYVVDGNHFSLGKLNVKYRIFDRSFNLSLLPFKNLRNIPLAVYLKYHCDAGYVVDRTRYPGNAYLANQLLWGNGIGLDFVSYYDLVFRAEYSINKNLQHGLFLHMKAAI